MLTPSEIKQLIVLTGVAEVGYVIQDQMWINKGVEDARSFRSSIFDSLQTVEQAKHIFFGDS